MERMIIGIDPGQKGAIVILEPDIEYVSFFDMPLNPNKEVDSKKIHSILLRETEESKAICIIEKAQPMPKQGVVSVFNYGRGYGSIVAVLQILSIPFQEIPAVKWKKSFSLNRDKGESITKALELFPNVDRDHFFTERGRMLDGRAEALLMAEYARRSF